MRSTSRSLLRSGSVTEDRSVLRDSLRRIVASDRALGVTGVLIAALLWQSIAAALDNPLVLPAFTDVFAQVLAFVIDVGMREHLFETMGRVLLGLAAGSVVGLAVGAAVGAFSITRTLLNPYLNFLRAISPIAWIVPATIWLGIGEPPILFVVIYASVFPIALNTISGIAAVESDKIRMARSFGLGPVGVFRLILVPASVPYVLVGARLALGFAFMAAVGAEMIIGRSGLGYLIFDARTTFSTDLMFAGILILGVVGYLGDLLFVAARRTIFGRYYSGRNH